MINFLIQILLKYDVNNFNTEQKAGKNCILYRYLNSHDDGVIKKITNEI